MHEVTCGVCFYAAPVTTSVGQNVALRPSPKPYRPRTLQFHPIKDSPDFPAFVRSCLRSFLPQPRDIRCKYALTSSPIKMQLSLIHPHRHKYGQTTSDDSTTPTTATSLSHPGTPSGTTTSASSVTTAFHYPLPDFRCHPFSVTSTRASPVTTGLPPLFTKTKKTKTKPDLHTAQPALAGGGTCLLPPLLLGRLLLPP